MTTTPIDPSCIHVHMAKMTSWHWFEVSMLPDGSAIPESQYPNEWNPNLVKVGEVKGAFNGNGIVAKQAAMKMLADAGCTSGMTAEEVKSLLTNITVGEEDLLPDDLPPCDEKPTKETTKETTILVVSSSRGDWEGVYVDGKLLCEDNIVDVFTVLSRMIGVTVSNVTRRTVSLNRGERLPREESDL